MVFSKAALQIIFKTSHSGWSEKSKSPQSYQIIGDQIKIFWLLIFCVILLYICRTRNFLWYQNFIYVIVILVFYIVSFYKKIYLCQNKMTCIVDMSW